MDFPAFVTQPKTQQELKRDLIQTIVLKQTSPTLVDMVIVYHIAKKMVQYDIFSLKM